MRVLIGSLSVDQLPGIPLKRISENAQKAKFAEFLNGEVRRKSILGTRVNKPSEDAMRFFKCQHLRDGSV